MRGRDYIKITDIITYIKLVHPFRIPTLYFTVNPRISPLGRIYLSCFLSEGVLEGRAYSREAIKLLVTRRIKNSLSTLLFSEILKKQSRFEHWSLSKSSSSSRVGAYSKGAH